MQHSDILILGSGRAALAAAEAARGQDAEAAICMVSRETLLPYARPLLTKVPLECYDVSKTLIHERDWYDENRIRILADTEVYSLHYAKKEAETSRGNFFYEKCIYALGAANFIPPIPGIQQKGVFSIRDWKDLNAIRRYAFRARNAVIIGGGVIGLEAAYQLSEYGLQVTVLETAPYLMPRLLDEASSRYLESRITKFRVYTNIKVQELTGKDGRVSVVIVEGRKPVPAELVIVSCGVRANCRIAQEAGMKTGRAVMVNERMETNLPDIYACGDCAEYEGVSGGLWSQALAQGRVAGSNAAGGNQVYSGADTALLLNGPEFSVYSEGGVMQMRKEPREMFGGEL